MCRSLFALAAVLAFLVLTLVVPGGQSCPRSCNCYQANEVHCTFRSLLTIPPGLPAHTRRINLGFNSISKIHDSSLAGLKKAELLMLHSNDILDLPDGVFRDMKSLQILKLSYNKLGEISSSLTFSGLTSLLRLYLDHNLLQHIHPRALLQLPSLRLLRLQGNRLHQLHPHSLCTLSLLNTYYFSTLRHLDLSNNSLTTLPKDTLVKMPLLETLVLHTNPWSCDCRMNWFLSWSLAHPGLMKCPGGSQCPICVSPNSLQGRGLLDQTDLSCTSPVIPSPGRGTPLETELSEIQSSDAFGEPLGAASLSLSDQQGNSVDLSCNITHSSDSQDIAHLPDLSLSSSSPLPLALSLSLECPVERQSYEKLWRILAYYSETAVRLEREIMLSKAPALAYRYKQSAETGAYYHTGVKASIKAIPQWLLQPAISIQLNRAQSNGHKVHLIYSTRVSAHPGSTSNPSASSPASHPWVLILTNHTITALAAVAGRMVELSCPHLSSGNPKVQWILPDGSKLISSFTSLDGRLQASATGLLVQKVQLSDAGLYYCVAQSGKDVDVLPLRLTVEESSLPSSGVQVGPPVMSVDGEPLGLPCKASGSPAPLISWVLPDGTIIRREVAVSSRFTVQSNGTLSLSNPSLRDAGYYRCIAVNQYGSDSLSTKLELKPHHPSPLRTLFPRGPQSAAGRSTKIRAPLLRQMEEGSGDEEEEEERTRVGKPLRPLQPSPSRRYPIGKPIRRGSTRGRPVSSTDQRRNRHRGTANKQRIDPKKWADLLAKIRQKTAHIDSSNQPSTTGKPTAELMGRSKDRDTTRHGGAEDTDRSITEGAGVEVASEGSSVDDTVLQEEGLQPIHVVLTETQIQREPKTETVIERETETQTQNNTHTDTHRDREPTPQMEIKPESQKEPVTTKPVSGRNDIIREPAEGDERGANLTPSRSRPHNRLGVPSNLGPNSRPQSPWNSRRRIEQRRRINRPRVQHLTPHRPLPDPTNQWSQTMTPDTVTDQMNILSLTSTTTSPAILLRRNDHIKTAPNGVAPNPLPPAVSYTLNISISASPSLTSSTSSFTSLSPSHTETHTDMMTHSADIPDTAESTLFNTPTPAPTHSDVVSETHVPDTHDRTLTQGIYTHTQTQTALGKHVDRPPGKHSEEQEMNLLGVPYTSPSITNSPAHSSVVSSTVTSTATTAKITTPSTTLKSTEFTTSAGSTTSTYTITTNPNMSITTIITATPSTIRSTTASPASTTKTTPILTSATPTTPSLANPFTTTTTFTTTTLVATSTKSPFKPILTTSNINTPSTATTTTPTTRETTSSKTSTATTSVSTPITLATTTPTSTSTRASSRERSNISQINPRGKPVSGTENQNQRPTDWKNPGANSIPDSHSSRPQSPPHPAVPWAPVVRSRPRISDPHIRTASFPAESTARMTCEAQGEPKPSITWTKVSTGAVMSIHSRAQRFEVLPNGTLVIQNVQLQDRGTYICSAYNFLGRDRLLTTLEVWTRPPRMQLMSYREATIHQGGELHLACQAHGVPAPVLSWVLPDRSVLTSATRSTSRISMDTNGTLYISVTLPSDRGLYRCVASNSAGATSASVRVHVSSFPPVIQQAREEHLLLSLGRPVYAHCSTRGSPTPTLRWRIPDGTLVRPSQFLHGNLFVLPNGTLHIRKVGPKDSGSYECTASNVVGADKRTVRVEIEGEAIRGISEGGPGEEETKKIAPEKTSLSLNKDKTVSIPRLSPPLLSNRSRTLSLTPSSSSYSHQHNSTDPLPKINKAPSGPSTHLTNNNETQAFSLSSTVTPNNTKVLSSIGNNTSSDKSRASDVLHLLPNTLLSKARIVSTSPSITSVQYGDTLHLHCSVTGNPSPIIIWRTPNRKLVDMHFSFDRRLKVHSNGTLSVQAVTEKDAGDFLCIARNKVADDYRLMRVSVVTKPAKIEPKQPLNQMVLLGKPLKVDCQASGLPDPDVRWSLPDGTMVNSVLQGEDRGGRVRRLTVFDNGTLLVPAVGKGEEGEYTCYAENQGGQDTMKVKVKVMMTPPTFIHDNGYHVIKVQQGSVARIRCRATGDPAPSVTWFSPARRVIPQSLGSGYYSERVVVLSDGTLEVRLAQKIDAGNYTCQAHNSAGEGRMVVGLKVETSNYGQSGQIEERRWSSNSGSTNSRSGDNNINNAGMIQYGFSNEATSEQSSKSGYSSNNSRTEHILPSMGTNIETSGSNPALRNYSLNEFNRPVSGITVQIGSSGTSVGVGGVSNTDIKAANTGVNRNRPGIISSISNSVDNSHSRVRGESIEKSPGTNNNKAIMERANQSTSRDNSRISGVPRNDRDRSSVYNSGAGTGTLLGNGFSSSSHAEVSNIRSRNSGDSRNNGIVASSSGNKNSINTVGVSTTVRQQAVKGQTVLLPCPSQGSPPPRLSWFLPGNGVLPAPYYGSRLTVHRNGSLELRSVRASDVGTLICVVRGESGETRIRVELEVSEPQEEARSNLRGQSAEKTVQKGVGLVEVPQPRVSLDSAQSFSSRIVLPGVLHPRIPVTQTPLQKIPNLTAAPRPIEPPANSAGPVSEPAVSTRTAPLVSIINGETLRLPCPAPQTPGYAQGTLSWTTPSGKVLSQSERSDRYQVYEDGTLTVQHASVFDRGTYTCRSTSYDSSSVSVVTVPVIIIAYPPRITTGPSPVTYTRPGVAVELPCLTIATPQATVTWETPDLTQLKVMGQARIYGNHYLSPQGSLVIQKPTSRDTGFYRCTAKNVIGMDTKVTYLHVI